MEVMEPVIKEKLRRYHSEEQIQIMELMENLGFHASSVNPRVFKDIKPAHFKNNFTEIEWMPIDGYRLESQVISQINDLNRVSATPIEFIGSLLKMDRITGVRICLLEGGGHLVATEHTQRTICSIFSGDGFGLDCLFAVKQKSV